jgi:hypothetical protein
MGLITGPAVHLTRNQSVQKQINAFRISLAGGFRRGAWGRLSAGDLRLLSGAGSITRPGHHVWIFKAQ